VWSVIRELLATGATILLTTQYLDEADQLAGRVAGLAGGRVVADDTSDQLEQRVAGQRLDLVLAGHVVASMVRNAVSTVLVFGEAFLIGFRPDAGPLEC
jgi:ABC-type multidrug transport system ATPase subunit